MAETTSSSDTSSNAELLPEIWPNQALVKLAVWEMTLDPNALSELTMIARYVDEREILGDASKAFYDYSDESQFTKAMAESLIEEVKGAHPNICDLNAETILRIQKTLCLRIANSRAPYDGNLSILLELIHRTVDPSWDDERFIADATPLIEFIMCLKMFGVTNPTISEHADVKQCRKLAEHAHIWGDQEWYSNDPYTLSVREQLQFLVQEAWDFPGEQVGGKCVEIFKWLSQLEEKRKPRHVTRHMHISNIGASLQNYHPNP